MAGPLSHIKVLDLSRVLAGPWTAQNLADLGAEVIKVERPGKGDDSRAYAPPFLKDEQGNETREGAYFCAANRGKKSITVNLSKPEGQQLVRELAKGVDVLVENYKVGDLARYGLGYEDLAKLNPGLVYCSVTGFGQTGPNANRPGYAHIAHSMTGWLAMQSMYRDPPQIPTGPGIAIADVITGITAFGAICAALFKRERTGRGERIDVSLFDSLFAANDESMQRCLIDGVERPGYHAVHATLDGYVTANVGPDFRAWQSICKAMGRMDLLEDRRFSSLPSVNRNRVEATRLLSGWLATLTSDEADRILTEHHVVVGVVKTIGQAARQPQVLAREMITPVYDPVLGRIDVINTAAKFSDASVGVSAHAPTLGEHNSSVLGDLLGYDAQKIAALTAAGVLRTEAI
jgi:formyl-CoA transferase